MKKISLVDYIGYSDNDGVPVGHPLKVIREFKALITDSMEVETIAPQNYLDALHEMKGLSLPLRVNAIKSGKNTIENIKCMLISFINIHTALKKSTADTVWFCNVDQFLFIYLGILGFHHKNIVVTCFAKEYHKKYHNYYFQQVLPKLSLVISSNPEVTYDNAKIMNIPDYLYKKDIYQKYCLEQKQEKVICVGTMNRSKQIKELVEIFNKIHYPLEIYGLFYEQEYYEEIMIIKREHIRIENRYIDYEEYLKLLGEAKFSILPYKQEAYMNFTSGVILESIFVDTVPITCQMLLHKMELEGIAYLDMKELQKMHFMNYDAEAIRSKNREIIRQRFAYEHYQNKLEEYLVQI